MEVKDYIAQWEEVKEMTEGKTMDDIRTIFANDITNDLRYLSVVTVTVTRCWALKNTGMMRIWHSICLYRCVTKKPKRYAYD